MPYYVFLCTSCKKKFTLFLHIDDLEKGGTKCPECGGKKVKQQLAAFAAVTSKKS